MSKQQHKYGCPYCGKPTWGMPTEKGFQWAVCDACLETRSGLENPNLSDENCGGNGIEN